MMGATTFSLRVKGKTAAEAFSAAVAAAKYENGHGGYSGTIAEKDSFVIIPVPEGAKPVAFARGLLNDDDERVSDKWGPAGCIEEAPGVYLFFGWASE